MNEELKVYEEKMEKSINAMMDEFASIRAGRANPHVLDKIKVDYYGTPDADSAGGKYFGSRGADDRDPAVGKELDQSDRESDPGFRSGNQSQQRRQRDPAWYFRS